MKQNKISDLSQASRWQSATGRQGKRTKRVTVAETYFRAGASLLRNIISPQKQNLFRPNDGASHRGKAPHETKAAVRKTTHIKNGSI